MRFFMWVEGTVTYFDFRNEIETMTKLQATLTALGALLAFSAPAFAQDNATPVTSTDRQFLVQDAQGSISDYANGAAAVNRAQSPAVRQLGIWIMEDHNRLNIALFTLAQTKGVNLPLTMAAKDQSDLDTLTAKQGADFDRAWLQQAIKTNKQDVSDAQKELDATTDPEVKPLVKVYLATEYSHLTAAQAIMGMMK
jgi:putative membrane protein